MHSGGVAEGIQLDGAELIVASGGSFLHLVGKLRVSSSVNM